jgi:hypothetical protein
VTRQVPFVYLAFWQQLAIVPTNASAKTKATGARAATAATWAFLSPGRRCRPRPSTTSCRLRQLPPPLTASPGPCRRPELSTRTRSGRGRDRANHTINTPPHSPPFITFSKRYSAFNSQSRVFSLHFYSVKAARYYCSKSSGLLQT